MFECRNVGIFSEVTANVYVCIHIYIYIYIYSSFRKYPYIPTFIYIYLLPNIILVIL